jgi:hypothetical protein
MIEPSRLSDVVRKVSSPSPGLALPGVTSELSVPVMTAPFVVSEQMSQASFTFNYRCLEMPEGSLYYMSSVFLTIELQLTAQLMRLMLNNGFVKY